MDSDCPGRVSAFFKTVDNGEVRRLDTIADKRYSSCKARRTLSNRDSSKLNQSITVKVGDSYLLLRRESASLLEAYHLLEP